MHLCTDLVRQALYVLFPDSLMLSHKVSRVRHYSPFETSHMAVGLCMTGRRGQTLEAQTYSDHSKEC